MERLFSNKKITKARQDISGYCYTCDYECASSCSYTCRGSCDSKCVHSCWANNYIR
ncbi:Cys-rich RiPP precursor [Ruminiclostridium herbifermentans]|uniref:Cys-rich RiPP n=1 Tax=Ruminiclostridium herbifermentans TaxID=2488810 RepID=A0A7H1VJA0_9FIRM|nr:AC3_0185 family rSAM-modified Cys-rich RiPP [Ruminiclostridium herbifermentans]QNU65462.1 Cys-rich RiPP precursor [Ruminiclostridium herbifermentans]